MNFESDFQMFQKLLISLNSWVQNEAIHKVVVQNSVSIGSFEQ